MYGKIIVCLGLFLLSLGAYSKTFNVNNKQEDVQFGLTKPGMIPFDREDYYITISVYPLTPSGKKSDPLTGTCGWGIFNIKAGESYSCYVQSKEAYFGIGFTDFKNGSFGKITLVKS